MISISDRVGGVDLGGRKRCVFVAVNSYESRTLHALKEYLQNVAGSSDFIIVDYQGGATSQMNAERRRTKNREALVRCIEERGFAAPTIRRLDPYSFNEIQQFVRELVRDHANADIVLDVTCMTKVHAIGIGACIAQLPTNDRKRFVLAYVIPDAYGILANGEVAGWQRVIIAPLVQGARLENERDSRGILLPGFESDRLIAALAEVEPAHGVAVIQGFDSRPELGLMATEQTNEVLRLAPASQWDQRTCSILDPVALQTAVSQEASHAQSRKAPVFLYAFGPKPTDVIAALELSSRYPEGAWFVYPVPNGYAHIQSAGIDRCLWYRLA